MHHNVIVIIPETSSVDRFSNTQPNTEAVPCQLVFAEEYLLITFSNYPPCLMLYISVYGTRSEYACSTNIYYYTTKTILYIIEDNY